MIAVNTVAAWQEAKGLSACPEWRVTRYKSTVAAIQTGKVRMHRQTPNTDDTEKCGLEHQVHFFFTADTNIWTHSFNDSAN